MLSISDELINDFSNGTSAKQVEVELEGYDYPSEELNYFISDGSDREWKASGKNFYYIHFYDSVIEEMGGSPTYAKPFFASEIKDTMYLSMDVYFEKMPSAAIERFPLRCTIHLMRNDGTPAFGTSTPLLTKTQLLSATKDNPARISFSINPRPENAIIDYIYFEVLDESSKPLEYKMWYKNIALNEAINKPFHKSLVRYGKLPLLKSVITNENIEREQMSLTESLCSGDNLLFGSAEASCINIGVVDTNEEFNNRYIKPIFVYPIADTRDYRYNDVNFIGFNSNDWYSFNKNASLQLRYRWDFISFKADEWLNQWTPYVFDAKYLEISGEIRVKFTLKSGDTAPSMARFYIYYDTPTGNKFDYWNFDVSSVASGTYSASKVFDWAQPLEGDTGLVKYTSWGLAFRQADGSAYTTGQVSDVTVELKHTKLILHIDKIKSSSWNVDNLTICQGKNPLDVLSKHTIPLGRFKVDKVQKTVTHTLTKKNITAYDDCYNLEQNASDWYTFYMFGLNSYQYDSVYGFEYARQIYSSYFNIAKQLGIEKIDYDNEEEILRYEDSEGTAASRIASGFSKQFENGSPIPCYLHYTKSTITDVDSDYLYRVRMEYYDYMSDKNIVDNELGSLFKESNEDPYGRGLTKRGSICIAEYDSSNKIINKYLVDSEDYFKVSDECVKFDMYVPYGWNQNDSSSSNLHKYVNQVFVYRLYKPFKLTNASTRLVYYRYYKTKGIEDIFACDSSISARDVLRSLLEPTGCFYHLDRYGQPKFIYCTKAGLYPSNTLYPADDLYPRAGADGQLLALGKYITFVADDYIVRNIGRIQILKNTYSNESKSVCEWEYIGDKSNDNTYIMSDNIFYCNEEMVYEYDAMPEVAKMLENMYHDISNLGYVPNTTVTYGMPWTEVGDRIGLLTEDGGLESFLFRRTMNGIQKIRDTFESKGDEYTKPINNYSYKAY